MKPETAYEYPRLRPVEAFPVESREGKFFCLRDPLHYAARPVYVPAAAAALLSLFDGRHSLLDIQAAYARRFGALLFREELERLIASLDEHLLLDGPRFAERRAALEQEFRAAATRPASLAGQAYPAEADALRRALDGYFIHPEGPGEAPPSADAARLVGMVVPHIDFGRGGPCYAWGYRESARTAAERYLVLGTAHVPTATPFVLTRKPFETPLGSVPTDHVFVDRLVATVGPACLADEFAHRAEHSIELQAVFLRHRTPADRPLRIVPILCGSFQAAVAEQRSPRRAPEVQQFLAGLQETRATSAGPSFVVASADLAHVGPQFGDEGEVTAGQRRALADQDAALLRTIEAGDAEGFFATVMREGDRRRICGLSAIYAALALLAPCRGRVLRYSQWPDPQGTVTFAAIGLYGGGKRGAAWRYGE